MNLKGFSCLVFIISFCVIWATPVVTSFAQPTQENLPDPKGGSELSERVKYPVSNYILQERYPETIFLSGDRSENRIALTFDDGPDPRFTPQILDVLQGYNVKATFFLMGARAKAYPELVQRIIDEGHIIGNHTYWHPDLVEEGDIPTLQNEVNRTEATLAEQIGYRTKLFRAPYGFLNNELVEKLQDMNYSVVGWTVDSLDWQEAAPEVIAYNVLNNIHPVAIILMHDGAEWEGDRTNTIEALRQIIPTVKDEGFEFTTVPELVDIPYKKD